MFVLLFSPSFLAKEARALGSLRALGLFLADGAPTVGWGKTFWCIGRFFESDHNSETKSQKIYLKVRNKPFFPRATNGLLTDLGSYSKNRIFGPKTELLGPKNSLLKGHHILATTGQNCAN